MSPKTLRVATYNIHRAVGRDRRRDTGRIAAVIREVEADIIGLQEVDWRADPSDAQVDSLARMPGYHVVAGSNIFDHRGEYGNLLLTRPPVRNVRRLDLTVSGREPRGAIDVDLDGSGWRLRIVVTHFGLRARERWQQAVRLGRALEARANQPAILLGDFNDWTPGCQSLRPLLRVCRTFGRARSFPAQRPIFALDRILARGLPPPVMIAAHASSLARQASDHLPVVAEIESGEHFGEHGGRATGRYRGSCQ